MPTGTSATICCANHAARETVDAPTTTEVECQERQREDGQEAKTPTKKVGSEKWRDFSESRKSRKKDYGK